MFLINDRESILNCIICNLKHEKKDILLKLLHTGDTDSLDVCG